MKTLWAMLIVGQILSAGNMNYQQEMGYHEINPMYGEHPSKGRVYITKLIETGSIYTATKLAPKHKKKILKIANTVCWGFIIYDQTIGVELKFDW